MLEGFILCMNYAAAHPKLTLEATRKLNSAAGLMAALPKAAGLLLSSPTAAAALRRWRAADSSAPNGATGFDHVAEGGVEGSAAAAAASSEAWDD